MPEWAQFREAITAGLPNTGQLLWLRTIEGWLTLAPQATRAALTEARKSSAPQLLYRSMVILNLTIEREAQIHTGPDSGPALQQLFSEVQQGRPPTTEVNWLRSCLFSGNWQALCFKKTRR
jgi:hypothetical protein